MGDCMTKRDRKNEMYLNLSAMAWMGTWVAASFGFKQAWFSGKVASFAVIGVVTFLGFCMVFFFRRFLKDTDELLRKIQLDALGIGMGAGLISCVVGSMLYQFELMSVVKPSYILMSMSVTYMVAVIVGRRQYR